jgi:hypothetical protein
LKAYLEGLLRPELVVEYEFLRALVKNSSVPTVATLHETVLHK